VRAGMIASVNDQGGTGGNAQLRSGGPVIAGKTGTSQVRANPAAGEERGDSLWEHNDHALFVAYFPANAPRYALAAVVEHGGGGGATAAPLVRDVIEYLVADDPAQRPDPWATGAARPLPLGGGLADPAARPSDGYRNTLPVSETDEDKVG